MVFIQTLAERTRYTDELDEVAANIIMYQTANFLPKTGIRGITKEGGSLERTVKEVKETPDGKFVIDGLVAEPFKPQYSTESDYFRSNAFIATDDYISTNAKPSKEEDMPLHIEIEERIRDSKYRNMGIPFGTGKPFSAKKNEFWNNVLSKMGSYFALTSVCYSFA